MNEHDSARFANGLTGFDWVGSVPWVYPVLEALHIVGIGLLLGSLVVFEMRVWGRGSALDVRALGRLALTLTLIGFGLAAITGFTMFASAPGEMLANRAFVAKMGLLVVAGANAALFHWRGGPARLDAVARLQTALSLGIWLAVIMCGRWIAYL